jgi:hypothetical protein
VQAMKKKISPADAVALFSHQLDNALSKHKKKELFEEIDEKIGLQQCEKPKSSVATPKFKFEGNARQYEFNSSRIDEVHLLSPAAFFPP